MDNETLLLIKLKYGFASNHDEWIMFRDSYPETVKESVGDWWKSLSEKPSNINEQWKLYNVRLLNELCHYENNQLTR